MELEHRKLRQMLETAIVAARLAGQKAMEELQYLTVEIKNGTDLVTQADTKCQKIIMDRVKETYPDHGFIAEEGDGGQLFKQPPRGEDFWWIIDPIDGTNNYAHKMLAFTISIAVMHQGVPVAGVIFEPATDSMFTAVKDADAQLNSRKITAGDEEMNKIASVAIDSHYDAEVPAWVTNIIKQTRFRNLGSTALHLAYVAKGSFAGMLTLTPKLWDIAAGAFIAESAEAVVTNWKGQKIFPIDLNSYQGQPLSILAANKTTHPKLLKLINE